MADEQELRLRKILKGYLKIDLLRLSQYEDWYQQHIRNMAVIFGSSLKCKTEKGRLIEAIEQRVELESKPEAAITASLIFKEVFLLDRNDLSRVKMSDSFKVMDDPESDEGDVTKAMNYFKELSDLDELANAKEAFDYWYGEYNALTEASTRDEIKEIMTRSVYRKHPHSKSGTMAGEKAIHAVIHLAWRKVLNATSEKDLVSLDIDLNTSSTYKGRLLCCLMLKEIAEEEEKGSSTEFIRKIFSPTAEEIIFGALDVPC